MGRPVELLEGQGSAVVRRSSFGALLGIMPWNFPYYQVARFGGAEPDHRQYGPVEARAPVPAVGRGDGADVRRRWLPRRRVREHLRHEEQIEWVIADPRVRGVSVTGSERAGAAVAEIAGRHLTKVVLEIGGSDPFIVLGTDDLDKTVEDAVAARIDNAGQSCNGAKRMIVIDELYEPFLEKFTAALRREAGRSAARRGECGPLSSSIRGRPARGSGPARGQGGREVVAGGKRNGNYFEPTVLTDITPENDIYREELFGPVAQVYRVRSEEEAVALANDTPFGLGSYVMTNDRAGRARCGPDRRRHGLREHRRR